LSWDFGGGAAPNTSSLASPSVTLGSAGSYSASLTLSNAAGSDTFEFTLDVTNPAPPSIEDVQPQSGGEGDQLSFTATLSGGPAATYAWDFGGGATPNTDSSISPYVTLGAAGIYPASLTVSNAGGSDTFDFSLSIAPGLNSPPTASFTANPQSGSPGEPVDLDASGSTDSDGNIVKYEWDLNGDDIYDFDGGSSPDATTTLPDPEGIVEVSLRVTDNRGATDETTKTLSSSSTPPSWHIVQVHSTSEGIDAPPYLAELNGLPAVAFGEHNFAGKVFLSFA
jgi:PKD repeat protein